MFLIFAKIILLVRKILYYYPVYISVFIAHKSFYYSRKIFSEELTNLEYFTIDLDNYLFKVPIIVFHTGVKDLLK